MPKLKLGINADDRAVLEKAAQENTYSTYAGETPPAGVYPAIVKGIQYKESKNGNKPMIRLICEFKSPAGSEKAKYNGYAIFHHNLLPVDRSDANYGRQAGNTKQILEAIAQGPAAWKGYQADDITVGKGDTPDILAFGSYKHNAKAGAPVIVVTKDEDYEGERRLRISSFNQVRKEEPVAAEAAEDEDDEVGVIMEDDVEPEETEETEDDSEESESEPEDDVEPEAEEPEDEPEDDVEPEDEETPEPVAEAAPPARRKRRTFA